MRRGEIEVVYRLGQVEIAVGVEPIDELRALVVKVCFDGELTAEVVALLIGFA